MSAEMPNGNVITGFLTRQDILDSDDLKRKEVEVPEWGGKVMVQELTAHDRDAIDSELVEIRMQGRTPQQSIRESALVTYRVKLVAAAIVDPNTKKRLFSEKDIEVLGQKSSSALARVYDVARQISGITEDDVEEVLGNSDTDQNESSLTA